MIPAQRSRFESLAIEWGAAFDIGPDKVRALDDRRLTDLCRCFAVIALSNTCQSADLDPTFPKCHYLNRGRIAARRPR